MRVRLDAPIQSCVLAHVTTTIAGMEKVAPVDLVFQSIAGTQAGNRAFGISLACCEAREAALSLQARHGGRQRDVFRDGAGSELSSGGTRRRRSADARGALLRLCAAFQAAAGEFRRRVHRARNICMTESRSPARAWKIISAESCSACRWAATSVTPTMPKLIRTTWTRCSRCLASPAARSSWACRVRTT